MRIQQATKPQTLGIALKDSPAGQLAWIAEKLQAWSDSGGDLYRAWVGTAARGGDVCDLSPQRAAVPMVLPVPSIVAEQTG